MSGRIAGLGERELVEFTFDGEQVSAWAGDSIAMALWAVGQQTLRNSSSVGEPRGVLCNMGICYECLVVVDGATVRSCTTMVRSGMKVQRGGKL
jgi:aerobic-type carbon monoxide dehydrogenase small subunit (CoxS/CutS family)